MNVFNAVSKHISRCSWLKATCAIVLATGALALVGTAMPSAQATTQHEHERIKIGEKVPDFTVTDIEGKTHKLSDYKDKIVVFEWINPTCPFVRRQHSKGPLKELGNKMTKDGIVFIAINSDYAGAPGSSVDDNKEMVKQWDIQYPVVLDGDAKVAKIFGARTTPDMFVIDKTGTLAYSGAIDNAPFGTVNPNYPTGSHGSGFINYVEEAVKALQAGKTVEITETHSYGCNVKY